uniref:Uncharacterized protein n=1 Tax=viral metagenome TaxID=1070528 RepID=A0A6M3KQ26_9ZZZZ
MTPEQYRKATGIMNTIDSYKKELQAWQQYTYEGVVSPLQLRMCTLALNHIPSGLFIMFKTECIISLQLEIARMEKELASL